MTDFYNNISSFYDEMIHFEKRLQSELKKYQIFFNKYPIHNALDAGCGSGLHSIVLSKSGLIVTGIDISDEMLKRAEKNIKKYNCPVKLIKTDLLSIHQSRQKFDGIFCLGNTIPHILEKENIIKVLNNFYNQLNTGGYLVLQLLNYNRILDHKDSIVSEDKSHNHLYKRYYKFIDDNRIEFYIQTKDLDNKTILDEEKTVLRPYRKEFLIETLKIAGFNQIKIYNEVDFSFFSEDAYVITFHAFK